MGKNKSKRGIRGQKGFTLVELVIVMAVLAVLAAIAIPRYNVVLNEAKVKSDGVTAAGIVSAARIQETSSGDKVESLDALDDYYFGSDRKPTSGDGEFTLGGGEDAPYVVAWTPKVGKYNGIEQTLTEGQLFEPSASVEEP